MTTKATRKNTPAIKTFEVGTETYGNKPFPVGDSFFLGVIRDAALMARQGK